MVFKKDKYKDRLGEKRQFERYQSNLEIRISAEDVLLDPVHVLIDISLGGIAFKSSRELREDDLILISIPADNPIFDGRGKVVWIKKVENLLYQVGVKFIGLDDASIASLMKFLRYVRNDDCSLS